MISIKAKLKNLGCYYFLLIAFAVSIFFISSLFFLTGSDNNNNNNHHHSSTIDDNAFNNAFQPPPQDNIITDYEYILENSHDLEEKVSLPSSDLSSSLAITTDEQPDSSRRRSSDNSNSNNNNNNNNKIIVRTNTGIWPVESAGIQAVGTELRVYQDAEFSLTCIVYEDNNSNGVPDGSEGYMRVWNATVMIQWGDANPFPVVTGFTETDFGIFSFTIEVNMPPGPAELRMTFNGTYITDGSYENYYTCPDFNTPPPGGTLVRYGCYFNLTLTVWHQVSIVASVVSHSANEPIVVGDKIEVHGYLRNAHTGSNLAGRTLRIFFADQWVADIQTIMPGPYGFAFDYVIPIDQYPGPQNLKIKFDPNYNVSNYYYLANETILVIKIYRPTHIVIEDRIVHRPSEIRINGTVLDNLNRAPYMTIGGEDMRGRYEVYLFWGKEGEPWFEKLGPVNISASGRFEFSKIITIEQQLTDVIVTVNFTGENIYYLPSEATCKYTVKAYTLLTLKLTDREGKVIPYMMRTPPYHEVWLRGQLLDNGKYDRDLNNDDRIDQADYDLAGAELKDMPIQVFFGTEELPMVKTGNYGKFEIKKLLGLKAQLGPIVITVTFPGTYWFEPSSIENTYYIAAETCIELQPGEGIKGEPVIIKGRLLDDTKTGISNKTILLYWKLRATDPLGEPIGEVITDANGEFIYDDYIIPIDQPLPRGYACAKFEGSPEFVLDDAYLPSEVHNVEFNISAYTEIIIDWLHTDNIMIRGKKFVLVAYLYEQYQGEVNLNYPIAEQPIKLYINNTLIREVWTLVDNPETPINEKGIVEFIINEIPRMLPTGDVEVKLVFEGTDYYIGTENSTYYSLTTDTRIEILYLPESVTDDEKFSIIIRLVELATAESMIYVPNAVIWINLSIPGKGYNNYTKIYTDKYGKAEINYSGLYNTGSILKKPWSSNSKHFIKITIEYNGYRVSAYGREFKDKYRSPSFVNASMVYTPKIVKPPEINYLLLYLPYIIVACVLFIVFSVLLMWWRKRARLRGMKAIIKRAADQLVAGNEYSAVIFKSYQKLCAHLRKYGYLRREAETFREFEEAVKAALPIDRENMHRFMRLLEEARYSHHTITEAHRNEAIAALRAIEASLDRIIIDEEAAMRALERLEGVEAPPETEIIVAPKPPAAPPSPSPHQRPSPYKEQLLPTPQQQRYPLPTQRLQPTPPQQPPPQLPPPRPTPPPPPPKQQPQPQQQPQQQQQQQQNK